MREIDAGWLAQKRQKAPKSAGVSLVFIDGLFSSGALWRFWVFLGAQGCFLVRRCATPWGGG
jgi:hypothetical protein